MTTRRVLLFVPTFIILVLLQSYFWVPTYEQQTRGNPGRLDDYIRASIGDATVLNPILSADHSSSEIEIKVFEGLVDRDEELRYRGRLATDWQIYEEAFFYVNAPAHIPDVGNLDAEGVADLIRNTKESQKANGSALRASLDNITGIAVLPAKNFTVTERPKGNAKNKKKPEIKFQVFAPARIKLVLKHVDQDLFDNLAELLGDAYFSTFPSARYISMDDAAEKTIRAGAALRVNIYFP